MNLASKETEENRRKKLAVSGSQGNFLKILCSHQQVTAFFMIHAGRHGSRVAGVIKLEATKRFSPSLQKISLAWFLVVATRHIKQDRKIKFVSLLIFFSLQSLIFCRNYLLHRFRYIRFARSKQLLFFRKNKNIRQRLNNSFQLMQE